MAKKKKNKNVSVGCVRLLGCCAGVGVLELVGDVDDDDGRPLR